MTAPGTPAPRRRRWATPLKALATAVIVAFIFRKVPLGDLAERMRNLSALDVAGLAVVTLVQVGVGVVRWWRLLRRLGEHVAFSALFGDVLVGLMYNMFLPTTVGGDVARAIRAARRAERGHRAWSTSIFERIAGLLAMASSGAIAALIGAAVGGTGGEHAIPPIPFAIRATAAALAIALLVLFFGAAAPFRFLVRLFERRLPTRVQGGIVATAHLTGIVDDLEGPLATPGARVETLAWSLLYQAIGVVFVVLGARALGAPGHTLAIVVGVPIVHVLSMLPITIGGLGLREGLFVAILGQLGVAPGVALGLAAQWLGSSVAFAIAGAIVALVGVREPREPTLGRAPHPPPSD